jgi:hypothetical protein
MLSPCDLYAALELAAAAAVGVALSWREQMLRRARESGRYSELQVLVAEARRVTIRVCLPAALLLAATAAAALAGGCAVIGDAGAVAAATALLACPASLPSRPAAACSQARR